MKSSRDLLTELWLSLGGDTAALDQMALTGAEPQLPSSFRVDVAAQVSIAASALASGTVTKEAFETLVGELLDRLKAAGKVPDELVAQIKQKCGV